MRKEIAIIKRTIDEVLNPSFDWNKITVKTHRLTLPVRIATWCAYYYTNISLREIGLYLGKRTHCDVLWNIAPINNLIETDYEVSTWVKKMEVILVANGLTKSNRAKGSGIRKRNFNYTEVYRDIPNDTTKVIVPKKTVSKRVVLEQTNRSVLLKLISEKRNAIEKQTDIYSVVRIAKQLGELERRLMIAV